MTNDKKYNELNDKYITLSVEKEFKLSLINAALNRISVSDDENEVKRHCENLINNSILEYKDIARKCHAAFIEFKKYCSKNR